MQTPASIRRSLSSPSVLGQLAGRLTVPMDPKQLATLPQQVTSAVVTAGPGGVPRVIARAEQVSAADEPLRSALVLLPKPLRVAEDLRGPVGRVMRTRWPEVTFHLRKGRRMWTLVWPIATDWIANAAITMSGWATCNDSSPMSTRGLITSTSDRGTLGDLESLTIHELDLLRLLGLARQPKQAAEELGLPVVQVQGLIDSLVKKLGLADDFQAALLAIWSGLVYFNDEEWGRMEFMRNASRPELPTATEADHAVADGEQRTAADGPAHEGRVE